MKLFQGSPLRTVVIAAAALGAGGIMYGRAERVSAQSIHASQVIAEQRKLPSRQFGDLAVVTLDDQLTLQTTLQGAMVTHTFAQVGVASTAATKAADAELLATEVSRFLHLRYVRQDVDGYLAWRRASGIGWVDRNWLVSTWFAGQDFESVTGTALTDDITLEQAFATLFTSAFAASEDRRSFVGVCVEGVRVARHLQGGGNAEYPYLSVGRQSLDVSDDLWYGSRGATMRPWFACKARRLELLQRGMSLPVAVVGLPMVNAAGERIPVITEWFLDVPSSQWVLEAMYINNYEGPNDLGTLNF